MLIPRFGGKPLENASQKTANQIVVLVQAVIRKGVGVIHAATLLPNGNDFLKQLINVSWWFLSKCMRGFTFVLNTVHKLGSHLHSHTHSPQIINAMPLPLHARKERLKVFNGELHCADEAAHAFSQFVLHRNFVTHPIAFFERECESERELHKKKNISKCTHNKITPSRALPNRAR